MPETSTSQKTSSPRRGWFSRRASTQPDREFQQRRATVRFVATLGVVGAGLAAAVNIWMFIQGGAWQMLVVAGGEVLGMVGMLRVRWLGNQGRFDTAGYLAVVSCILSMGIGELFHAGLTLYLGIGGVVMVLLIGGVIIARRWAFWLTAAALFGGYVWAVNYFKPLPRLDVTGQITFNGLMVMIVALIVILVLRQLVRIFRLGTIRSRLLVTFIVIVLGPALVIGTISSVISWQRATQQALYQFESVAALKENEVNAWIDSLYTNLLLAMPSSDQVAFTEVILKEPLESDLEFYQVTYDREKRRLDQIIVQSQAFIEVFMIAPDGTIMISTDENHVGRNEFGYPYFELGLEQTSVTPPFFYPYSERDTVLVVAPIKNLDGVTVGVLAAQANMASLSLIMLEKEGLGQTGESYLVYARNLKLETDTSNENWKIGAYVISEGIGNAAQRGLNGSGLYTNYRDIPVIGAYRFLPDVQLALLAEQEQSEAFATTYQTILINIAVALGAVLIAILVALIVTNRITTPITGLARTAEQIAAGDLGLVAKIEQEDEIGALADSFNSMTAQLRQTLEGLESQVEERTAALAQRSAYLQSSADVGKAVSTVLEPERLIQQVVELIRERFDLYYVGLFLVDDAGEWALLKAGTGEAGRRMLERGHQIKIGTGMIGWSIANQLPRIAQRAELDVSRVANPDLPETRSEAAIPLISRGRVIGALTIQSVQLDIFDEATVTVFETMADQVAVALDNARLFVQSQSSLDSLRQAYGEITREGWEKLLAEYPDLGFRSDQHVSLIEDTLWRPEMELAFHEARTVHGVTGNNKEQRATDLQPDGQGEEYYLGIPLMVRDNVIGVLTSYKAIERGNWSQDEVRFLEEVAESLSITLETARFFNEAQVRAETERLIAEISARIRQTLDIDTVIQTAAREMRQALNLSEVEIRLGSGKEEV